MVARQRRRGPLIVRSSSPFVNGKLAFPLAIPPPGDLVPGGDFDRAPTIRRLRLAHLARLAGRGQTARVIEDAVLGKEPPRGPWFAPSPADLGNLVGSVSRGKREAVWDLADGLRRRGLSPHNVARCRIHRMGSPSVDVRETPEGRRASYRGLVTCGSVWACPLCMSRIKTRRAEEIVSLVSAHGGKRALMLTLTVRHGMGDDLKRVREGVTNAYRVLWQGRKKKTIFSEYGIVGYVRALEVTHGKNGFHPHIHAIMLFDSEISEERIASLRDTISDNWKDAVHSTLGANSIPNSENGCDLRHLNKADYLSKLGLELSDPGTKEGHGASLTPLQIAHLAAEGDESKGGLWRAYCEGMYGARQLTWSKGLRERYGLGDEASDEELASDTEEREAPEDSGPCETIVISGAVWDRVVRIRGMRLAILQAAERGGEEAVAELLGYAMTYLREEMGEEPPEPSAYVGIPEPTFAYVVAHVLLIFLVDNRQGCASGAICIYPRPSLLC